MANWVYGRRAVYELLLSDMEPRKLLIAHGVDQKDVADIVALAREKNVPIEWIARKLMDTRIHGNHQGIALHMDFIPAQDFKTFFSQNHFQNDFVCLLDEIQDPQNLGAIIRNAVCFGAKAIVMPTRRSASVTDTVMRASSGAAAHIPILEIANLTVAIERLKEKGFFIYGADAEGSDVGKTDFVFPAALVLGNEHRGIKPTLRKMCDGILAIPQSDRLNSLNVASASAIFFHELSKKING